MDFLAQLVIERLWSRRSLAYMPNVVFELRGFDKGNMFKDMTFWRFEIILVIGAGRSSRQAGSQP
jgi:hypothetical protein